MGQWPMAGCLPGVFRVELFFAAANHRPSKSEQPSRDSLVAGGRAGEHRAGLPEGAAQQSPLTGDKIYGRDEKRHDRTRT